MNGYGQNMFRDKSMFKTKIFKVKCMKNISLFLCGSMSFILFLYWCYNDNTKFL